MKDGLYIVDGLPSGLDVQTHPGHNVCEARCGRVYFPGVAGPFLPGEDFLKTATFTKIDIGLASK